ncbi:OmpP1/FadL family transporter [Pseudomaricurvus sp.]|uniref:OmpP1/FadL family transporter n=1 Tax=Pseudomaricurvus sp. TaxID=2004510 RepID=UPI003F6C0BAB
MNWRNALVLSGSGLFVLGMSAQATAGGLWLNEYGDFSSGRASAGAAAGVDDASTMLHNPASMTRVKGGQLTVTAAALQPSLKFSQDSDPALGPGGGNGGDAGVFSPTGGVFYVGDLDSERWDIGIYFSGLAGSGLEYDDDWVGRYQATESSLMIAALAPTIAYRVTDKLSIGASMQMIAASLNMKLRTPALLPNGTDGRVSLDGTDVSGGYTLGVLYELSANTRIGINYQSELDPDFSGDLTLENINRSVATNTELSMAQKVRLGVHHELNEKLSLEFTLGWDDWSAFDQVFVSTQNVSGGLEKNSRDTTHTALGFQYRFSNQWKMTGGLSYDTNPMNSLYRTADLPLDRQVKVAAGVEYQPDESWKLSAYANYTDLGNAKIDAGSWSGEYDTDAIYQLGFSASWMY